MKVIVIIVMMIMFITLLQSIMGQSSKWYLLIPYHWPPSIPPKNIRSPLVF